jgi:chemotaxis protein MotB
MKRTQTKKRQSDSHDNADRWLLTYADLITLLLGLFVILYAISKVDNNKYSQVVQALGGMFGKNAAIIGSASALPGGPVVSERQEIENKVRGALYEDIKSDLVTISQDERGVVVHLAEELLFPSGSATLKGSSLTSMDLLASVLKTLSNDIRIEGHTDNVPIKTSAFPSNWHLSVARAMNAGDYLMMQHGLKPERVTIVGYSEYKPLAPNTSVENRAKNRRVDIVVMSTESPN